MRRIGITGGMGTGKSTVLHMLNGLGAKTVDADRIAREVVLPGTAAFGEIVQVFGASVLTVEGNLDRAALAQKIFHDAAARKQLNEITHPHIRERINQELEAAKTAGERLAIIDIPLLFESQLQNTVDGVLLVYVDSATQLQRLCLRDHLDVAEATVRLTTQISIEEKRAQATWIIDNRGGLEATQLQVERWWHELNLSLVDDQ